VLLSATRYLAQECATYLVMGEAHRAEVLICHGEELHAIRYFVVLRCADGKSGTLPPEDPLEEHSNISWAPCVRLPAAISSSGHVLKFMSPTEARKIPNPHLQRGKSKGRFAMLCRMHSFVLPAPANEAQNHPAA
jgi:hypothetical protein